MTRGTGMCFAVLMLCAVGLLCCPISAADITAIRVSCENFEGVRAQFAAHPAAPADQKNRLIRVQDAMSGLKLELTYEIKSSTGSVTYFGNQNAGGKVGSFDVVSEM